MTATSTILIVDDDADFLESLADILTAKGYQVVSAHGGRQAIQAARETPMDVVLSDIVMPGIDGLEACQEIEKLHPGASFLLMTGQPSDRLPQQALGKTDWPLLRKPFDVERLLGLIASPS